MILLWLGGGVVLYGVMGRVLCEGEVDVELDYAAPKRVRRVSRMAVGVLLMGIAGFVLSNLFAEGRHGARVEEGVLAVAGVEMVWGIVAIIRIWSSKGRLWGFWLAVVGMGLAFSWVPPWAGTTGPR